MRPCDHRNESARCRADYWRDDPRYVRHSLGGPFLMSFVTINPRIQSFINAMASSVLIAILTPLAVEGDAGARLALLTTAVVMLATRRPLPAIAAGIAAAALGRYLL